MNIQLTYLFLTILLWVSCGSTPSQKVEKKITNMLSVEVDTSYIPKSRIQREGSRAIDPQSPPISIDLRDPEKRTNKLDMSDYYTKARIVQLNFPSDSGEFADNKPIFVGNFIGKTTTQIIRYGDYLVAHDYVNDCFVFDKKGTHVATLFHNNATFRYDKRERMFVCSQEDFNQHAARLHPSLCNSKSLVYSTYKEPNFDKPTYYWWNLSNKKIDRETTVVSSKRGINPSINDSVSFEFKRSAAMAEHPAFLFFFNIKGDTIGAFRDYIKLKEVKKINYTGRADASLNYQLKGAFYIRQPYNDTIFRIESPHRIVPAYVMNFGTKKPTIDIGYYGNKSNFLFLNTWAETSNYILINYSLNYDCPNTRRDGSVTFNYALYDKQKKSIHRLNLSGIPEEAYVANSLEGGFPIAFSKIIPDEQGHLTIKFNKRELEGMIASKEFSQFPPKQQTLIKQLADKLSPRSIIVMLIE